MLCSQIAVFSRSISRFSLFHFSIALMLILSIIISILSSIIYSRTKAGFFWFLDKISPIARGLLISLCLCVCVTFMCTGRTFVKIQNKKNDIYRIWHFPSNGIITKIALHDRDIFLKILNINISEMDRVSSKMDLTTFVHFDISFERHHLRKLYSVTLTYF